MASLGLKVGGWIHSCLIVNCLNRGMKNGRYHVDNGRFYEMIKAKRWPIKSLMFVPQDGLDNDFIKDWKAVSFRMITRVDRDGL